MQFLTVNVIVDDTGDVTKNKWAFTYAGINLTSVDDLEQLLYQLKSMQSTADIEPNSDVVLLTNNLITLHSQGGKLDRQTIKKNQLKVDKYRGTTSLPSSEINIAYYAAWFTSFRLFFLRLFRELGLLAQFIFGRTTHIFSFVFTPVWGLVLTVFGLSYIFDVVCAVREASRLSKQYEISFWQVLCEDNYKILVLLLNGIVWESVNLLSTITCGIPISTELRDTINHDANTGAFSSDVPNDSLSLFTQWRKQHNLNKKLSACNKDETDHLKDVLDKGINHGNELCYALINKFLVATLILAGMIILYHAIPIAAGVAAHHFLLANTMWTSDIAIKLYGSSMAFFIGSCYAGFISRLRKTGAYQNFSHWLGEAFNKLWNSKAISENKAVPILGPSIQKQLRTRQRSHSEPVLFQRTAAPANYLESGGNLSDSTALSLRSAGSQSPITGGSEELAGTAVQRSKNTPVYRMLTMKNEDSFIQTALSPETAKIEEIEKNTYIPRPRRSPLIKKGDNTPFFSKKPLIENFTSNSYHPSTLFKRRASSYKKITLLSIEIPLGTCKYVLTSK